MSILEHNHKSEVMKSFSRVKYEHFLICDYVVLSVF